MTVLKLYDDKCQRYNTTTHFAGSEGQKGEFQLYVWLCAILTWIIVYFCVFKGVKSSSYVVWVTVPLPCVFILIMVFRGLTLPGADIGIKMYL